MTAAIANGTSCLLGLQYADQIVTFKLGHEVLPGITSVPATWHTPGQSMFEFEPPADAGASGPFLMTGDAANSVALSIENPTLVQTIDTFPYRAKGGRTLLMKRLARQRARALFGHAPFPGIGSVSVVNKSEKTFRWYPVY